MYSWLEMQEGRWSSEAWAKLSYGGCAIDPYLVWADRTRFADLGRLPKWVPVMLELAGPVGDLVKKVSAGDLAKVIRIASIYGREANQALAHARFCTAAITEALFEKLEEAREFKGSLAVTRFQLGLPIRGVDLEEAPPHGAGPHGTRGASPPPRRERPRTQGQRPVVVGVIDDSFAFAHARFRLPGRRGSSTRIEAFWDQGEGWEAQKGARATSGFRPAMPYGTELSGGDIDDLVETARRGGDEDEVYRLCGYRGAELRASHGTHVMDLACGCAPGEAGPRSSIVCVALPRSTTGDTSGLSLGVYALDALRYIIDRADRLVPDAQIVVNLSYGAIAGPHDGTSMLEAAIDDLITLRRQERGPDSLQVVIAAGNNHLARCHARVKIKRDKASELRWRVLPDDETPSFMEIWLPRGVPPTALRVRLTSPTESSSDWVKAGNAAEMTVGGETIATVIHLPPKAHAATSPPWRAMVLVAVAPTASLDPSRQLAPSGVWKIELETGSAGSFSVDAWIQRDDNVHGFRRRGRQSYFDDPAYVRLDHTGRPVEEDSETGYVRRAGTLNSIATGKKVIVVGGYRASDGAPARYSSSGPAATPRTGPDAVAVSERSVARRGVLAAGTGSGAVIAMNGTSVAAPQVTRWIAGQMAAGKPAGEEALRARAGEDDPDPPARGRTGGRPPRPGATPKPRGERGGAGRIRLERPRGEDEVGAPFLGPNAPAAPTPRRKRPA